MSDAIRYPRGETGVSSNSSAAKSSEIAAQLTFAAAGGFVLLLAVLHVIKPELDPSWRFISEYALGDFGWMMVLAFLTLAFSFIALFVTMRPYLGTVAGRIGLALLLISALGLVIAAIFPTDPITAEPAEQTTVGMLHNLGGTLGVAMPLGIAVITVSLARNRSWSSVRRPIVLSAGLAGIAFLAFTVSLGVLLPANDGKFGPEVAVGWPNRFEVMAYSLWLMAVARASLKLRDEERQRP